MAGVFLEDSHAIARLRNAYGRSRPWLLHAGIQLPAWNWDRNRVAPVAVMAALDSIAADLARSQPGEVFFAHLLLPHNPYVYDSECRARPPAEWRQRRDHDEVDIEAGDSNTPAGRALRYSLYLPQLRCAHRKIGELLDAIPPSLRESAVVVVHGDHGSRIGVTEPNSWRESSFGGADYADFFSTLFAVRSPGIEAGYDPLTTPVTCLLRTLVESDFRSVAAVNECSFPNVVFFNDHTPHTLPDFAGM